MRSKVSIRHEETRPLYNGSLHNYLVPTPSIYYFSCFHLLAHCFIRSRVWALETYSPFFELESPMISISTLISFTIHLTPCTNTYTTPHRRVQDHLFLVPSTLNVVQTQNSCPRSIISSRPCKLFLVLSLLSSNYIRVNVCARLITDPPFIIPRPPYIAFSECHSAYGISGVQLLRVWTSVEKTGLGSPHMILGFSNSILQESCPLDQFNLLTSR